MKRFWYRNLILEKYCVEYLFQNHTRPVLQFYPKTMSSCCCTKNMSFWRALYPLNICCNVQWPLFHWKVAFWIKFFSPWRHIIIWKSAYLTYLTERDTNLDCCVFREAVIEWWRVSWHISKHTSSLSIVHFECCMVSDESHHHLWSRIYTDCLIAHTLVKIALMRMMHTFYSIIQVLINCQMVFQKLGAPLSPKLAYMAVVFIL